MTQRTCSDDDFPLEITDFYVVLLQFGEAIHLYESGSTPHGMVP